MESEDPSLPAVSENPFHLNIEELSYLEEPDYELMRTERSERTLEAMRNADTKTADRLISHNQQTTLSVEESAAVCIQKHYRGYLGRRAYTELLFQQFEEEERQRQEKMHQQMQEGELLVENHKLEVLLNEDQTVRRNKDRGHVCKVITIQRAWRAYLSRKVASGSSTPTPTPTLSSPADSPYHCLHYTHPRRPDPNPREDGSFSSFDEEDDAEAVFHRVDRVINLDDVHLTDEENDLGDGDGVDDDDEDITEHGECENSETESAAGLQTMMLLTPEENQERYAEVTGKGHTERPATTNQRQGQAGKRETDPKGTEAATEDRGQGGRSRSLPSRGEVVVVGGGALTRSRSGSRSDEDRSRLLEPASCLKTPVLRGLQDSECESVVSDCSELGGPLRELEKEVEVVDREELRRYSSLPYQDVVGRDASQVSLTSLVEAEDFERRPGESESEHNRRVRKLNFLSLAQEFAQLKRLNAHACPLDFHLSQQGKASSMTTSLTSMNSSTSSLSSSQDKKRSRSVGASLGGVDLGVVGRLSSAVSPDEPGERIGSTAESDQVSTRVLDQDSENINRDRDDIVSEGPPANPSNDEMEGKKLASGPARGRGESRATAAAASITISGEKVFLRDHSARRSPGLRSGRSREGSAQRYSTPPQGRSSPARDPCVQPALCSGRPVSQPVDGDFEVFTMESSVPAMNWDLLEQQLQLAADEERRNREARQTDREEIRRRLAMGAGDDYSDYYGGERALKKPSLSARLQGGMNLQICFVNEAAALGDDLGGSSNNVAAAAAHDPVTLPSGSEVAVTTASSSSSSSSCSQSHHNLSSAVTSFRAAASSVFTPTSSVTPRCSQQGAQSCKSRPKSDPGLLASQFSLPPSDESIAERQIRLQQEAKMALAQASTMARMQLEVERKTKKKSPIADIVGVPELGSGRRMKISRKLLHEMNLAQLQVLVNDLHSQIENLNEELVHLLIERDDLHMEQDSMLVDIEDLTSFAQHMSETNNNKSSQNNRNSAPSSFLSKRLK